MPTSKQATPRGLTSKQLELRRGVMGGTDAAAILGLSRYKTEWDVYAEKRGEAPPQGEMSEDALWGILLEPVIRAEYQRRTDLRVVKPRRLIRSKTHRWQAGHLDGLAENSVLEIKTRSWPGNDWGEEGTDEIPPDVRAQVEHYLAVTGLPWADIAVLFRGAKLAVYRVDAKPEPLALLTEEEGAWWQRHIVSGEEPDFDGREQTTALIRRHYPTHEERELVALPQQYGLLEDFATAREQKDFYEQAEERLKQQIMAAMQDASVLLAPNMKITWRRGKDGKPQVDWESYAMDLEGLVEKLALGMLPVGMDPLESRDTLKSLHTGPGREGQRTFRVTIKQPRQLEGASE